MQEKEQQIATSPDAQMFISMLSNTYSFDSRFDRMQSKIDDLSKNQITMQHQLEKVSVSQELMQEQLRDTKLDMDRRLSETRIDMLDRFSQVDKRFEQVDKRFEQVDKRFEQVDKRFDQVDKRFVQVDKQLEKIFKSIDKLSDRMGEKLDDRDNEQRKFTLRMFSIAISISSLSVVGVFLKLLNVI